MQNCQAKWLGCFPRTRHLLTLVAFSLFVPTTGFSIDGLKVKFIDDNADYPSSNIYVAFCGQSDPANLVAKKLSDGTALALGTSYSLTDLQDGILLTRYVTGRLCIKLGKKFESLPNPGNGNNPNFNNPSLPDFGFRWDKAEITYNITDPNSSINLSATDFFSVRLRVRTYRDGSLIRTLTWQKAIATAFHDTGVLSDFSDTLPALAVCIDKNHGVPTQGPNSIINVVRVIAPSTIGVGVRNPYPSFQAYINHVRANAIVTKIEGEFFSGPPPLPKYEFTALVDSAGLLMTGTVTTNAVPKSHVIKIETGHLDSGIYTQSPRCNIDGVNATPGNDAIGAAIRDVLAGFSYGFIGSNEQNPNAPGKTFGESTSSEWHLPRTLPIKYAFAGAQPNHPYYNQYAAALNPITMAYGFPYSDFVEKPLASLDPASIDSMDITVLADQ